MKKKSNSTITDDSRGLRAFRSVTRPNLSSAGLHAPKRIWAFCDQRWWSRVLLWGMFDDDKLDDEVGWYGIAWVCPLWVVYSWNVIQVQLELSRNFCIPIWRLWILIYIVAVVDFFWFFVFPEFSICQHPRKMVTILVYKAFPQLKGIFCCW